jgi:hypothetical protein
MQKQGVEGHTADGRRGEGVAVCSLPDESARYGGSLEIILAASAGGRQFDGMTRTLPQTGEPIMTARVTLIAAALFAVLAVAAPAVAQTPAPANVPAQNNAAANNLPPADAPQDADAGFDLLSSPWGVVVVIGALILIAMLISAALAIRRWLFWGFLGLIGRAFGAPPRW